MGNVVNSEVLQNFSSIICGTWVFTIFRYWTTAQIPRVSLQQSLCLRSHPKVYYWVLGAVTQRCQSLRTWTQLLMAEGTAYSSFPSHLQPASAEPSTATSKFSLANPPVGGLQHNTWYFISPCQRWKTTCLCRKQAANNPYSPFSYFWMSSTC